MSARLAVWAQNGKDGLTAPEGARYLCIHICIAMLHVHCCTATSGLQIESAFNYLHIIGQTEMRPVGSRKEKQNEHDDLLQELAHLPEHGC